MDQVNKEYWFPVHAMAVRSTAGTGSFECSFRLSNLSLSLPRNSGKDATESHTPFEEGKWHLAMQVAGHNALCCFRSQQSTLTQWDPIIFLRI